MTTRNQLKKLAALVEKIAGPSDYQKAMKRLDDEFFAVLDRWWQAVPDERKKRVQAVWSEFCAAERSDPQYRSPALVRWLLWIGGPRGGWFPDPFPLALLEAYLDHPDADVGCYDCEECGLMVPAHPATGEIGTAEFRNVTTMFDTCPHCSGAVKWAGFWNKHGRDPVPRLGRELLAGRDPIAAPRKLK